MSTRLCFKIRIAPLILFLILIFAGSGFCQEINLDKMKKLGDLVCYQSLKDPATWYYLPDQPRLALKNGKPQFSFMKYSRTNKTGKAGTNVAEGGGIVHFLVTYGTSKDRVRAAQRRLQEEYPDAHIEGPVVYRKGSFALITSFKEDQEALVKTVAVGKAPLMEGQKAAVSMALSRQGAELLWESFKGDTPDISLVFDMEFAGVREPYEATIEADWTRVSKHKRLKAGMKYSWFGADVDMLFQELRQSGAIKITTKGENVSMDKIVESAHAKLLQVMFDPAPVDDLSRAAAEKDSYSSLNQAMKMLKDSKGSGTTGSIDMKSPGFKDMIAAILDYIIPEAHASSDISSKPFQDSELFRELTSEKRTNLRELFNRGRELYKAKNYMESLEKFHEYMYTHEEITGKSLPGGNTRYNIALCQLGLGHFGEAEEYFTRAADIFGRKTPEGISCLENAKQAAQLAQGKNAIGDRANAISQNTAQNSSQDKVSPDTTRKTTHQTDSTAQAPAETASQAYNNARKADEVARKSGYLPIESQMAIDAYKTYLSSYPAKGQRRTEVEGRIRSLKRRIASYASKEIDLEEYALPPLPGSTAPSGSKDNGSGTSSVSGTAAKTTAAKTTASKSAAAQKTAAAVPSTVAKTSSPSKKSSPLKKLAASKKPGFSLVASFQMKNIKRSGKMVYQMNHFRSEKQSFTMTENIGSLYRRYGNDSRVFKAVSIDDPVFKQREILVTLDGQDASTFTKYLNFVTVKMKKQHQSGASTNDEIVITPETFNASGNSFSLNYGYKEDTNRDRWLDYQYQVIWSFHGGLEIRSPWEKENTSILSLYPPYRYRSLTIEGNGEELKLAKVRHAVITISSMINGKEILTQATIRNQGPAPALHLEFPEDVNGDKAEVNIKWFLKGGKQLSSPEQKLEGDIIYWDELPEEGRS